MGQWINVLLRTTDQCLDSDYLCCKKQKDLYETSGSYGRQTGRWAGRQTGRQAGRQADRQAGRQADR